MTYPELTWTRLTADEVKEYFMERLDKKMPDFELTLSFCKSLHHLVEQGKVKAFKTPEGEIQFQYNMTKEICPEGDV